MTNWFLSLTTSQAIGVVFFGTIIWACLVFWACELTNRLYKAGRRAYRLSRFPDEHEFRDDPFALLNYGIDEMRDDIHVQHAKLILGRRTLGMTLHPSNFTCFHCSQQQNCPYAFDAYNTDDSCLMLK
jgi:hypothetical protein